MGSSINVSVIMPVFNGENYIINTLETIFEQSLLPFEVIIVDDGSTDNTVEILEEYKNNNKLALGIVKIYKQDNKGAGAARNLAIEKSSGNWLAFLDSDDKWLPDKLMIVKSEIESNHGIGIITHNEFEENEMQPDKKQFVARHKNYDDSKKLFLQLIRGNLFSTSCMVIRKDIVIKAGGFDQTLLSAQDYDLWIRCAEFSEAVYLEEALAIYLIRSDNITRNTYRRYLCELIICKKYVDRVVELCGVDRAKSIIKKRIFDIHKIEVYLSLKNKQFLSALKILLRLPVEYLRNYR